MRALRNKGKTERGTEYNGHGRGMSRGNGLCQRAGPVDGPPHAVFPTEAVVIAKKFEGRDEKPDLRNRYRSSRSDYGVFLLRPMNPMRPQPSSQRV